MPRLVPQPTRCLDVAAGAGSAVLLLLQRPVLDYVETIQGNMFALARVLVKAALLSLLSLTGENELETTSTCAACTIMEELLAALGSEPHF